VSAGGCSNNPIQILQNKKTFLLLLTHLALPVEVYDSLGQAGYYHNLSLSGELYP
jgi:hypothetical protein